MHTERHRVRSVRHLASGLRTSSADPRIHRRPLTPNSVKLRRGWRTYGYVTCCDRSLACPKRDNGPDPNSLQTISEVRHSRTERPHLTSQTRQDWPSDDVGARSNRMTCHSRTTHQDGRNCETAHRSINAIRCRVPAQQMLRVRVRDAVLRWEPLSDQRTRTN